MKKQTGFQLITWMPENGQLYKIRIYKTIKTARRGYDKLCMEYGSALHRKCINLETGEKVLV